jgi:hypothetical protein
MGHLSVLIFSRGDPDGLFELINDVYQIADEVVVVDSSYGIDRNRIEDMIGKKGLNKVKYFYVVPLGYPDPIRAYGLKKCSKGWVLLLDTDERLSGPLKEEIPKLIRAADWDGLIINRENYDAEGRPVSSCDYQLRLFRKDKMKFTGIVHNVDRPMAGTRRLPDNHCIKHKTEIYSGRENEYTRKVRRYMEIESYTTRKAYGQFVKTAVVGPALSVYFTIKSAFSGARMDDEITPLEYLFLDFGRFVLICLRHLSRLKMPPFGFLGGSLKYSREKLGYISSLPEGERRLRFRISQEIRKEGGVINYLNLDDEPTIMELNKTYSGDEKTGLDIFTGLLRERHFKNKGKVKGVA